MSAKRTVTVFRTSPVGAAVGVKAWPQFQQNFARSAFSSPQLGHFAIVSVIRALHPTAEPPRPRQARVAAGRRPAVRGVSLESPRRP